MQLHAAPLNDFHLTNCGWLFKETVISETIIVVSLKLIEGIAID